MSDIIADISRRDWFDPDAVMVTSWSYGGCVAAAHGIQGTHMAGSERYECAECGYSMRKEEAESQGMKFVLD